MFSMKKILFIFLLSLPFLSFATHERAGEITYRCIGPGVLKYEFTVTTYTRGKSCNADRCSIEINFGDDTVHYPINRQNGPPCPIPVSCGTTQPTCSNC